MQPDRLAFLFPDGLPSALTELDLDDASEATVEAVGAAFQDTLDEFEDDDPDPDDEFGAELGADEFGADAFGERDLRTIVDGVIARQILLDDPPQVWAAVRRMESAGLDREEMFDEIAQVLMPSLERLVAGTATDLSDYVASLDQLPMAPSGDIRTAFLEALTAGPVEYDELFREVAAAVGLELTLPAAERALDTVFEDLADRDLVEVILTAMGDTVVSPLVEIAGATFTTRRAGDNALPVLPDLVALNYLGDDLRTTSGVELEREFVDGVEQLVADEPWLAGLGDHVALTVTKGRIEVSAAARDVEDVGDLGDVGAVGDVGAAAAEVRAVYDLHAAADDLPTPLSHLVLGLLARDPDWFGSPRPPLGALVSRAGLELRGDQVAHTPEMWRADYLFGCMARLSHEFGHEGADFRAALSVVDAFIQLIEGKPVDLPVLREVLEVLSDEEMRSLVGDALLLERVPDAPALVRTFADRLRRAASRSAHKVAAAMLAALAAERAGEPLQALDLLREAVAADPRDEAAADRLAWTLSDHGQAADARVTWNRAGLISSADLEVLPSAASAVRPLLARNDPCWCGSGRKYKVCHLRIADVPALADRFAWVQNKPLAYLARRGGSVYHDLEAAAREFASADAGSRRAALIHPLVFDVVLHEFGWEKRFLAERGALLPDDERALVATWVEVPRSVYQVEALLDGRTQLRDLRTDAPVEIGDSLSDRAAVGSLLCARVLPDGGGGYRLRPDGVVRVPRVHQEQIVSLVEKASVDRGMPLLRAAGQWQRAGAPGELPV